MTSSAGTIELGRDELRAVTGYAAACARAVLAIFERFRPDDPRPRAAVEGRPGLRRRRGAGTAKPPARCVRHARARAAGDACGAASELLRRLAASLR